MIGSHLLALIPIHSLHMARSSRNELVKYEADHSLLYFNLLIWKRKEKPTLYPTVHSTADIAWISFL